MSNGHDQPEKNIGSAHCVSRPMGGIFDPNPFEVGPEILAQTLKERGQTYGDYGNMSYVAQKIKDVLRDGGAWPRVNPAQRESLDLIATKLARIVCGDPNTPDSWLDIEGYAKLARDRSAPALGAAPLATP